MCRMFPSGTMEPEIWPGMVRKKFSLERPVRIRRCSANGGDRPMTFNPVSYFAGIGTVFVAVAVGFGGGLLITSSDHKADPPNRLERIAASAPLASTTVAVAPASAPSPSATPQLATPAGAPASD